MCSIVRHCQILILPCKSHALGDCFKNQMIAKQTMKIVLHFLSIQQWDETLAVLFETSPPSDSDERSEVEKEEGPLKVLGNGNSAFFFFKC